MKEFTSIHEVTFADVLTVLEQWNQGIFGSEDVLVFAESLFDLSEWGWPKYAHAHPLSVLFAALEMLELVYVNPILKEDIPALQAFLQRGQTDPLGAWSAMERYWASIDWDTRVMQQYKAIQKHQGEPP